MKQEDQKESDESPKPQESKDVPVSEDAEKKAPVDDPETDKAVEDIVATESDKLLEAEDEALAEAKAEKPKRGFWGKIGHFFATSHGRWITFGMVVVLAGALFAVPNSRYRLLNEFGVQASLSITTVDNLTQTPLKNVKVMVDGRAVLTDSKGLAAITGLRLGPAKLTINQTGFAPVTQNITVGWGSNPLGTVGLKSAGVRYTIAAHDYLTGGALAGVEARSGDAVAVSDAKGNLVLTLAGREAAAAPVTLSKAGYRSDQILLGSPDTPLPVTLVIAKKAVFISKESGKYDVYKSDIDGQNKQILLAATGSENSNSTLVVSPDNTHAALVSTRDNLRDADGYLLSSLSLISVADGSVVTLGHAEQIQLIDWIGGRLIFEQVSSDPSTPVGSRYSIISHDAAANTRAQLGAAGHINAVFSARGVIYYAVGVSAGDNAAHPALYKVNPDGSGKQTAFDKEVWSGQRVDYNTLDVQTADGWYSYDLVSNRATSVGGPASFANRLYVDNTAGMHSLWVDTRGGKGALVEYDVISGKDTDKTSQSGLTYPVRWLTDDVVLYRAVTGSESADYALSLAAGVPHKIADVTNTYGFSQGQ